MNKNAQAHYVHALLLAVMNKMVPHFWVLFMKVPQCYGDILQTPIVRNEKVSCFYFVYHVENST